MEFTEFKRQIAGLFKSGHDSRNPDKCHRVLNSNRNYYERGKCADELQRALQPFLLATTPEQLNSVPSSTKKSAGRSLPHKIFRRTAGYRDPGQSSNDDAGTV